MFHGSMVALVTPMQTDGSVDFESLRELIDWHIESGTQGIVSVGTTGESATLDFDEHCEIITRTVEYAAGRVPIIAGTGANSTREAIHLTEYAEKAGVAACLLVTPYYNKPTQEGLYRHYRAVAEAVAVQQLLYNVPGRTAVDLQPDTVVRLAEIPNIVGIKEAVGDAGRIHELVHRLADSFAILSGDDATALDLLLAGGHGVISVTANVAPTLMQAMCAAAARGDRVEAAAINERLNGLHHALFIESNPIPVKWALNAMGRIPPGIRLPLTPLSRNCYAPVLEALAQADIHVDQES
jgi:4-hydroxy-tetrahydrodipicolinate synthase